MNFNKVKITFKKIKLTLNKKLIFLLGVLIIIPLIILLMIYLTPSSRNLRILNTYSNEITLCNIALKDAIDQGGINLKSAEDILSTKLISLNDIKSNIFSQEVVDGELNTKSKLLETLTYNISTYELCLSLIRNPKDKDIITTYNSYSTTYSLCINNYEALALLGIKAKFPEDAKNFFQASFNYFNILIKLNRESDIRSDQNKSYVTSMKECITLFNDIDEDLQPALNKIREEKRSLDVLSKDIKIKKSKLNEIKNKSYSLTIPDKGNECYSLLENTINYYDLYIIALEHSIVVEKSSSSDDNSKTIQENYTNSFSKYTDFIKSLKDLNTELDNFNK
jgi:hypothetical protein